MPSLLQLLQLTDSGFPTGGYAYSHGLEYLLRQSLVTDFDAVQQFMSVHLQETLIRSELPLAMHAHRSADLNAQMAIDWIADALKPIPVIRESSVRIGRRFLDASIAAYPNLAQSIAYREVINRGRAPGHHAVAYGVVTAELAIDRHSSISALALTSMQGYVAAAVRLSIIGQTTAQRLLAMFIPEIDREVRNSTPLQLDELGGFAPTLDLAALEHRKLSGRLFAS